MCLCQIKKKPVYVFFFLQDRENRKALICLSQSYSAFDPPELVINWSAGADFRPLD